MSRSDVATASSPRESDDQACEEPPNMSKSWGTRITPSSSSNGPFQLSTITGTVWLLERVTFPASKPISWTVPFAWTEPEAFGWPELVPPSHEVWLHVPATDQAPAAVNAAEEFHRSPV